ncbi:hypothetical protein Peur_027078 [Populus x canadensis]
MTLRKNTSCCRTMLNGLLVGLLVVILVLGDHTTVVLVLTKPSALLMHSRRHACMPRITEVAGVVLSFDPKANSGNWTSVLSKRLERSGAHKNYSALSMRNEGGCEVIKKAIEKLGLRHKEHIAGLLIAKLPCVGRDIEKEGKGYYEDTRPASNMDLYVATSMIVETTILWKPWESQAIPQTK